MKSQKNLFLFLLFIFLGFKMSAQKNEVKPYSIASTYEKLKKDYPFITPIKPFKAETFVARENLVYKKTKVGDLKADVYLPKAEKGEKFPGVLLIHGGGWLTGSKENLRPMAQRLAAKGYVTVTAAYRLGTDAVYPAGVVDLKDAVKWMKQNADEYGIDSEKIAVLGASAGAHLATLLGVTPDSEIFKNENKNFSDEVQAIVNIDGIVSFIHPDAEEGWMAATWLGGSKADKPETWKEASPLEYVDSNTPPTLFINSSFPRFHAGRDDMVKILNDNQIYHEVHTIDKTPHAFWLVNPWFDETLNLTTNFLNRIFKSSSSAREKYREISVSKDGGGDFTSIQEAIDATRDLGPGEVVIQIKNGVYNEKLEIHSWKHQLTLVGEDRKNTIITNNDFSGRVDAQTGKELSTFTSYTVLVRGNDIKIENLTIQNTSCGEGQAVALHVEGDRFVIKDADILGCQDTLYTAKEGSRQLYSNCYIEGTTDFIFGEATAVFLGCTIKSLKDSFVTAAATPQNQEYGYVFFDCELIAAEGVKEVYLGRPWRPYAKTVFINSHFEEHILPEGWDHWPGDKMFPNKERTAFYAEYNSKGPGASPSTRVKWSHQLDSSGVQKYNLKNIFSTNSDWFWATRALND